MVGVSRLGLIAGLLAVVAAGCGTTGEGSTSVKAVVVGGSDIGV